MHSAGVMKIEDVRARVDVGEAQADGDEVAGARVGEAAAEEEASGRRAA